MSSINVSKIFVAIWHKDQFTPAGIIGFDKERNISGFQYLSNYNGPPIDPINLNYKESGTRTFTINKALNNEMLHRVFQDALPGAWGMSVLMSENPELKNMNAAQRLYWFGSRKVGGLSCKVTNGKSEEQPISGIDKLAKVRSESIALFNKTVGKLVTKAAWWGLCSHGGARPKTSFVDDKKEHWLVKFNLQLDGFNGARVENSIAKMAKHCGINSVSTKTVSLPDQEDVLFIKRYDRGFDNSKKEYRVHQISMFSMLDESKVRGPNEADYNDLANVIKKVSIEPEEDLRLLFRQMLFHIAIHNADDHAKNFSMILTDKGYRLAPAYDMTPSINDYPHCLSVNGDGFPSLDEASVSQYAEHFGISEQEASEIRDDVINVTIEWRTHMRANDVSEADIKVLERAFSNGIDNPETFTQQTKANNHSITKR